MDRRTEERIGQLAAGQHGLVTRAQLLHAGLGQDAVKYRVRAKRLVQVDLGVYRIGPLVSPHAREMAAVLACGDGAVVSHLSAAVLWDLVPPPARGPVDVTVPHTARRRRRAVRVHRIDLAPDEVTRIHRIPVTTVARSLVDLSGVLHPRALERALAAAERPGRTSRPEILALVARSPRRPGIRALRALLVDGREAAMTRSEAEERLLALVRRGGLPAPCTNIGLEGYEVDLFWPDERVVVEVDGFAFHASRSRFEADRRRDAHLTARGYRVVRITWRQIVSEPEATLVRLAATLLSTSG